MRVRLTRVGRLLAGRLLAGPGTLRGRLALGAVLVTAGCLVALTFGFNIVLSKQLRGGADDLLHTRAAATAAGVDVAADGTLTLTGAVQDRALSRGTWVYEGDTALQRAAADRDDQRRADALAGVGERTVQSGEPDAARFFALPLRVGGRQVGTVVSSVQLDPYDRVADLALVASAVLAALVLGGAYLLTRSLVGRALTPVAEMTEQAARWSASDQERRLGAAQRPRELEALATTLDGVLDRLTAVIRHEQQLSAELSHELRTPLAAIVAEVELLDSRPRSPQEIAAGHASVLAAADRMGRVLESLLTAARVTMTTAPGRCHVLAAVQAAVASVDPPPGSVLVREQAADLMAGVDGALLERALAPVLDNALRYRRELVTVTVGAGPGGPWVRVQDDGPGVPPDLGETAFEPGRRSADSRSGAGLGLALARRLARAGGGDLCLEPALPGASFRLALPAG